MVCLPAVRPPLMFGATLAVIAMLGDCPLGSEVKLCTAGS